MKIIVFTNECPPYDAGDQEFMRSVFHGNSPVWRKADMKSLYSVWARNGNTLIRHRQWLPFFNERKEFIFYSMAFHS